MRTLTQYFGDVSKATDSSGKWVEEKDLDASKLKTTVIEGDETSSDYLDTYSYGEDGSQIYVTGGNLDYDPEQPELLHTFSWSAKRRVTEGKYKGVVTTAPIGWENDDAAEALFKRGIKNQVVLETDNPNLPVWISFCVPKDVEPDKETFIQSASRDTGALIPAITDYLIFLNNQAWIVDESAQAIISGFSGEYKGLVQSALALSKLRGLPFKVLNVSVYWEGELQFKNRYCVESGLLDCGFNPFKTNIIEDGIIVGLDTGWGKLVRSISKGNKMRKQASLTIEDLEKALKDETKVNVSVCFTSQEVEGLHFITSAFVDKESTAYQAVQDIRHSDHPYVIKNLYLEAMKRHKISPRFERNGERAWDYQVIITNGITREVKGVMTEFYGELSFDILNPDGTTSKNTEIRARM